MPRALRSVRREKVRPHQGRHVDRFDHVLTAGSSVERVIHCSFFDQGYGSSSADRRAPDGRTLTNRFQTCVVFA